MKRVSAKVEKCCNCDDYEYVSVDIPCPNCKGNNLNEIVELQALANWIEQNFKKRSRAPEDGIERLKRVRLAQGNATWKLYEK